MSDHVPQVRDDTDESRYEVWLDGLLVGSARYVGRGHRTFFVHTEIEPAHEGAGLGSILAARVLDAERSAGTKIVPLCPFVRNYIDRHPQYADLVDDKLLAQIDGE
ncbi:MAG: N-acetyltransferase [Acidimicrobiia bacterium]|nr:N-acetyltransferase [Acidimicrobiia bacterium]MDQ3543792.1 N-acetyltransferase [Actinomycetota bacterium]